MVLCGCPSSVKGSASKKPCMPASRIGRQSPGGGRSGGNIRAGFSQSANRCVTRNGCSGSTRTCDGNAVNLDELGYVPLSPTDTELLFETFLHRHEPDSMIGPPTGHRPRDKSASPMRHVKQSPIVAVPPGAAQTSPRHRRTRYCP